METTSAIYQPLEVSEFHSSWFWARPSEGFYLVNVGFLNSTDSDFEGSKLFSFGSLYNDKSNDMITVTED